MMDLLAPALLAGLLAIAIPVVLHLVQRERKQVVAFPSLMFLRKIPYQSVRRRVIRDWPLLLLRALVIALFAVAFARPFLPGAGVAAGGSGDREVVILLDRSASMAYGDHFERARNAARQTVESLRPGNRASVVLFASGVEIVAQPGSDRGPLLTAIDAARPGVRATRYGTALQAAAGLLESSPMPRREIVLISDFQRTGWDREQSAKLAPAIALTTVSVGESRVENAAVVDLAFARETAEAAGERVTVTARIANRGVSRIENRALALEADGRQLDSRQVSVEPGATASVSFAPLTVPANASVRVVVRLSTDRLATDNVFHSVLTSRDRVPVLAIEGSAPERPPYLAHALSVSTDPDFEIRFASAARVTPAEIDRAAAIVLNDAPPPAGVAGRALEAAVNRGTGLLVALGERSSWGQTAPDLLPGTLGIMVDRSDSHGGTLGSVDRSHALFEIFRTPRSGDLTAARVFRFRQLDASAGVLARFDDGSVAVAERQVGRGRVIAWTSTLDGYWNDLVLKPVFVPFLHQAIKYLAGYVQKPAWQIAGEAMSPSVLATASRSPRDGQREVEGDRVALSPSGARLPVPGVDSRHAFVPDEQGFYEVRSAAAEGTAARHVVAVNVDPAESNLTTIDPAELAAAMRHGTPAPGGGEARPLLPEDRERRQALWWYLLALAVLVLAAEALLAGRLSRAPQPVRSSASSNASDRVNTNAA